MADLSKIKLNGTIYNFKDTQIREDAMIKGIDYVTAGKAEGITLGTKATAEGYNTSPTGNYSHAEGSETEATGSYAHAEGFNTHAGTCAHVEGRISYAGPYCHAEGDSTVSAGIASHTEGNNHVAFGVSSHAEGHGIAHAIKLNGAANTTTYTLTTPLEVYPFTRSSGLCGYLRKGNTDMIGVVRDITKDGNNVISITLGNTLDAENAIVDESYTWLETTAKANYSHVEGDSNVALGVAQHVGGKYNIPDNTNAEIIGNGTDDLNRSNARTLDWNGNETLAGKLTVGIGPTNNMDVATKQYVDNAISGGPISQVNADWEATSGVAEILNKPTIPTVTDTFSALSSDATSGIAVAEALTDYVQKTDLATPTTNGLMSATDKQILDNMNPNISVTISDIYTSETHVINAKQENMVDLEIIESPHISQQIRTSNLLNVDNFTPGFYIGSNGTLSSNTNDHVGDFIPVSPGDNIYYTGIIGPTASGSINRRLHVYDATQKWIKQLNFAGNLKVGDHWSTNGVIPSNGAYVRVSWGVEDTNVMISVGAPDKYWPYYITPFSSISSASFQISSDDTYTNATTYTVTVPAAAGDLYGFKYNPITGKLYATTRRIASYNGETLPATEWYSDRDIYAEGTTPSIGAEVIYQLEDEDIVEYDITPQTIPMFFHTNYIKTDTGIIVSFSYYAETFGVSHITISNGATVGNTDILESDVQGWNHAAELIDDKANLVAPAFTGNATAPTLGIAAASDRIATTLFTQRLLGSLIAPLQESNKATKNYEVGEYFIFGGVLYKVTAAIATNGTITPGTNVEATTVMAEIVSLLS